MCKPSNGSGCTRNYLLSQFQIGPSDKSITGSICVREGLFRLIPKDFEIEFAESKKRKGFGEPGPDFGRIFDVFEFVSGGQSLLGDESEGNTVGHRIERLFRQFRALDVGDLVKTIVEH